MPSALTLDDWLGLRPGVLDWLQELDQKGYVLGSDLAEAHYLGDSADGSVEADKILRLLEAEGLIRRGEMRASHSQKAFSSLGNMARAVKGQEPATWFAWHPPKDWRHPAFRR